MSCNNCISNKNGLPRGCNNNGKCSSESCGTFTVFNLLSDISNSINRQFKIVEVRFKNGRKEFSLKDLKKPNSDDIVRFDSTKKIKYAL